MSEVDGKGPKVRLNSTQNERASSPAQAGGRRLHRQVQCRDMEAPTAHRG